jgi:hypothetical protein
MAFNLEKPKWFPLLHQPRPREEIKQHYVRHGQQQEHRPVRLHVVRWLTPI